MIAANLPGSSASASTSEAIFKPDIVRRMLLCIFGGEWKAGDRLREETLATLFKVSRTPVREALQELAAVGLAELRPNCGAVVAPFGPREIEEIYEVRALLESEATRLACPLMSKGELEPLQEQLTELLSMRSRSLIWSQWTWNIDRQLHGLIASRCPNRRLAREIARYDTFVQIIRETGNRDRAVELAIKQHREIVDALLDRDQEKAASAMRRHILNAGQIALAAIRPRFTTPKKTRTAKRSNPR